MWIILFCCVVSAASAALLCTIIGPSRIEQYAKPLSLFAMGILLALGFGHLLPEALSTGDEHTLGLVALCGIMVLFSLEMFFDTHGHDSDSHSYTRGGLGILLGSYLHTFCDGVVIASAFCQSTQLGTAVTLAVLSHEIAHELGDYAIMLELGLSTSKAYIVNLVAALGTCTGGLCAYFLLERLHELLPFALCLSGTSFIYVALADLLPRLKHSKSKEIVVKRITLILGGIVFALIISAHD
ncbi:MAG: ZIP family metal transporter [Succinivibrio sp.]|nr:ZIP family metal transporter [Succinivibrio sp.]